MKAFLDTNVLTVGGGRVPELTALALPATDPAR